MWTWWLWEVIPALMVVGGVYMVVTQRLPRPWPRIWVWNVWKREKAGNVRSLGWYYVSLGGAYQAFFGYLAAGLALGYERVPWALLIGLVVIYLLLLGLSWRWRRRALRLSSSLTGRPVEASREGIRAGLLAYGYPAESVEYVSPGYGAVFEAMEVVTDTVTTVTGRPATTFAQFAEDAAGAWR